MYDNEMNENRDPLLSRLFADCEQDLRDTEFLRHLHERIEHTHRQRLAYKIGGFVAALAGTALIVSLFSESIRVMFDLVASGLHALDTTLQSPIAWTVAAALTVAFAPAIYLWRKRRL